MAKGIQNTNKILGREYDPLTATYRFRDGSGTVITAEQKEDAVNGRDKVYLLGILHLLN